MPFDSGAYLERIGLAECQPTLDGLRRLQFAQLSRVAFENIAPYLGVVPDLSAEAVWNKLVVAGRGGYCFELNGLLGAAMSAIGFAVRPVLGRVRMGASVGGPRTHLAWLVTFEDGVWLADAGFGGPGPAEPLNLSEDGAQAARGVRYRIRFDSNAGERVVERETPAGWFALYGFDEVPVPDVDIEAANFLCSRWSRSPFPNNLMLHRVTEAGRISLFNKVVRKARGAEIEESAVGSFEEFTTCLEDGFGLRCDEPVVRRIWDKLCASPGKASA